LAGVTSIEGLSGIVDIDSPLDTINVNVNGQVIELDVARDPRIYVANFTPGSGAFIHLPHAFGTEDFVWSLWKTDIFPICSVIPDNIFPSGSQDAYLELATPMSGKLVLISVL
jgi:hypothetical protein